MISLAFYKKFALSTLLSLLPSSSINVPVWPKHLTIAIAQVILEIAFVDPTCLPSKDPVTFFFVVSKMPLVVGFSILVLPDSWPFLDPLYKLSFIHAPIRPIILPKPMKKPILECSFIYASVFELLNALAMLHTISNNSLVFVSHFIS